MKIPMARKISMARKMQARFWGIVLKWFLTIFLLVYVFVFAKLGIILFVWLPWVIGYNVRLYGHYMQYDKGFSMFIHRVWIWWFLAIISLIFLAWFEYRTHYSHKRRTLERAGAPEGRVVWIKGLREGLLYDCWDAYNYIQWALRKKKGRAWKGLGPDGSQIEIPGSGIVQWPDPMAIPIGPQIKGAKVLYLKRSYFRIWPELHIIPDEIRLRVGFFRYILPHGRFARIKNPGLKGLYCQSWVYYYSVGNLKRFELDPKIPIKANKALLSRSRVMVRSAIESDPETTKRDYERGSLRIPTLEDPGDSE